MLTLQHLDQAGAAQHLGIQAFGGQEQDGEVGGVRRLDVFLGNRARLGADAQLQGAGGQLGRRGIGALLGVEQALVILVGELGVDRQPQRRSVLGPPGQSDGKVHRVAAARAGDHLLGVLVWRQHLLQQGGQLRLTEHAPGFDVGEQVFEIAHALGQGVHLAQALVHLVEPVGHLLEALAQAGFERALQLLVDGLPHLVEFGGIALLQLGQRGLQGGPQLAQAARIGLAQALHLLGQGVGEQFLQQGELLRKGIELGVLAAGGFGALAQQGLLEGGQRLAQLLAGAAGAVGQLTPQLAFGALGAAADGRQHGLG